MSKKASERIKDEKKAVDLKVDTYTKSKSKSDLKVDYPNKSGNDSIVGLGNDSIRVSSNDSVRVSGNDSIRVSGKDKVASSEVEKRSDYKGVIPRELIKGRPRIYKSVEAMASRIAEYLEERQNMVIDHVVTKDKDGKSEVTEITGQGPMSISSLCDFLGITDETFENYGSHKDYKKFHALVAWAKQKICGYHEDTAATSGKNKADFILINRFKKIFSKDASATNVNVYPQILVKEISNGEVASGSYGDSRDIQSASEDI